VTALLLALWRLLVHGVDMARLPSTFGNDGVMADTYAVDGPRGQAGVALAADHLLAVVLGGKGLKGRLDDTTTETEDQVKSRLLLDVVVGKSTAVLELLAGEDQALLVRGNALLVCDLLAMNERRRTAEHTLDLGLDIVDGVRGLDLKRDGLSGKCLDEDLHSCGCCGVLDWCMW
jgi:hypothetical protein